MKWFENVKTRLETTRNAQTRQEQEYSDQVDDLKILTRRERNVFDLLLQGMKLNDIAAVLGVAFSTVNSHTKSIYKKLGVNSRTMCIIRYGKNSEKDVDHELVSKTQPKGQKSRRTV